MESVDNLDRALLTVPVENLLSSDTEKDGSRSNESQALFDLYQGLKMTEKVLMQTLKKHGLERFDPSEDGARFDPRLHEAVFQTKDEGKEDGEVMTVQQKGFMLNGRVLRVRFSPSFLPHDFAEMVNRERMLFLCGSLAFLLPEMMGKLSANMTRNLQAAKVGVVKNY